MENVSAKQVPVVGKDDKREIHVTVLMSVSASGDLLVIYFHLRSFTKGRLMAAMPRSHFLKIGMLLIVSQTREPKKIFWNLLKRSLFL